MTALGWLVAIVAALGILFYHRVRLPLSTAAVALVLLILSVLLPAPWYCLIPILAVFAAFAVALNVPPLRRRLISDRVFGAFRKALPPLSETEQEALRAGTIGWEGELFSGAPRWRNLRWITPPALSAEEQAFVDGPVDELCRMLDDWDITHHRLDLPPEVWRFIKEKGFFGMIIPKRYGGLGFSALAHSEVVMKLSTRSTTGAVTVMVPNSLGPAELLLHYGTEAQRDHYLPRLARGEEIPCFALTGPEAGSDAGAMTDTGIVCRGQWNGEEVVGLRLNWEKRYITLGPVATVLGLAVKVYDPDRLLGEQVERGISLALIPTHMPGVRIGRRHFPLDIPFQNGPNWGENVFIPLDYLIGGEAMIGHGWTMLMNCLSVGRSISLPATATGAGKFTSLMSGAYARVRHQFNVPIGEFEGIQEALARIGGNAYLMDAARRFAAGAVDQGEKPAVASAIVKYHLTERMRQVINDAMDIHGGRGICLGPSNYLGRAYQGVPISITVEGANILTRSLMIFGQGAIRCHPYLLKEMLAAAMEPRQGAQAFDRALFGHIGLFAGNKVRAFWLGLSDGRLSFAPGDRDTRRYYQRLSRLSAAFALVADATLMLLGGALKRKESLSGRLGDCLSYLYLGSAVLKHYQDQGCPREDLPLLDYALQDTLYRLQESLSATLRNFPSPLLGRLLAWVIFPVGRGYQPPGDRLTRRVARLLLEPGASRDRLVAGSYRSQDPNDPVGKVEYAFTCAIAAAPIEARIRRALKAGEFTLVAGTDRVHAARAAGIIDEQEANTVERAARARRAAIQVDDFDPAELLRRSANPGESHAE